MEIGINHSISPFLSIYAASIPFTQDLDEQQKQRDKLFMVFTLFRLRPELDTVRHQILGNTDSHSFSVNGLALVLLLYLSLLTLLISIEKILLFNPIESKKRF